MSAARQYHNMYETKICIPQEIFNRVVHEVRTDVVSLAQLCLASHIFLAEARKALYTDVTLNDIVASGTGWRFSYEIPEHFFATLTQYNPELALYVHSFTYSIFPTKREPRYWALMNECFRLMINLKKFGLECEGKPTVGTAFRGCSFQLDNFHWRHPSCSSHHVEPMKGVIEFLSEQRELKSLSICVDGRIPAETCPKLETLSGGWSTIKNVLPGRSTVTKVAWKDCEPSAERSINMNLVSTELSNLRVFVIGEGLSRIDLARLIPYLSNLETLSLLGHSSPDLGSLNAELALISQSSLPNLRIFAWAPTPKFKDSDSFGEVPREIQEQSVMRWFGTMPKLQVAYFGDGSDSDSYEVESYSCWTRDGVETACIPWELMTEGNINK
ncbi:hypothetical protein P691DRAFT_757828 [Macrolepiota fuliginosa MF-IS2]|uniref:Uncharacterized protein n=1 Tax=Macrolepiota fuliginosa MF-IS2 TaxID=1400762 RepID=A0A9P5XKI2_9AGAR|nr:hypothetical protein P691DRAFT_757828 [Macrolepiota fuliginosa MF-IS2]